MSPNLLPDLIKNSLLYKCSTFRTTKFYGFQASNKSDDIKF